MPRLPINYKNIVIYKIVCNDLNITDVYVGSTTDFTRRNSKHKYDCSIEKSTHYNLGKYQKIRANGGWENWTMVQIETYPCNSSQEARARERYYYELFNATLNGVRPYITETEIKEQKKQCDKIYRENNKDKTLEYNKLYRINNLDEIKEKKKQYFELNKETISEKHKLKYLENKEAIAIKGKIHRDLNKEKINERRRERNQEKKRLEKLIISV